MSRKGESKYGGEKYGRQRAYRARMRAASRCTACGKPADGATALCLDHKTKRKRYRIKDTAHA